MILARATLILPDRLLPDGWVQFSPAGVIVQCGSGAMPHDATIIDLRGQFLSPGFVDLHVHGALRRDAMEATAGAFAEIAAYHASGGTTALALTTVSSSMGEIIAVLEAARDFPNTHAGARLLGVHVEGPYLSPQKAGAQNVERLHPPTDQAEIARLLDFSEQIVQVTLAPELPGALPFISQLRDREIIVSGGHSDAWDDEAEAAFVHGMTQVTHVYNCMSSARRRGLFREAGLLEYALSEAGLRCELIADGRHVTPTLMKALYRAKGVDGILLITDATAGAGLAEGEGYELGDHSCIVGDGVGMLLDRTALAGSVCRMIDGVRNLVEMAEVPLCAAVRMATLNPAEALGRQNEIGTLQAGARADFVIFSADFQVRQTWVGGQIVYGD